MGEDDLRLLERLRQKDRDALAAAYDAYSRLAFGLAYRVVGEATEAEDVVQEAFVALWRQADKLDASRGSLRSLLLTIVHRRAVDAVRRRAGRPSVLLESLEPLPSGAPDPLEVSSVAEEQRLVQRALAELPQDQRKAVELTYFGGLTIAEMAEREGIPLGTAKSRLRLALDRMRKSLAGAV
jgi:RNA polymerase sigma-70 factor (ECF subfamily)